MARLAVALMALFLFGSTGWAKSPLKSETEKISYLLGFQFGSNLTRQGIKLDLAAVAEGMQHGTSKSEPRIEQKEAAQVMNNFRTKLMAKMKQEQGRASSANQKAGADFLANNLKKEGVQSTKSGLQYRVLTNARGAKPGPTDTVRVHYEGRLINGTVFDSSVKRGKPAEFPVNGVIPGWTEALQLMSVGSKWQLTIPSELAYGPRGMGGAIPPNSVLVFDVELLKIK